MNQNEKLILELLMEILLIAIKKRKTFYYGDDVYERAKQMNLKLSEGLKVGRGGKPQATQLFELNKLIREKYRDAPTISAIVISKTGRLKDLPGTGIDGFPGFVGYKQASLAVKRRMAAQEQAKVFKYPLPKWQKIYTGLFKDKSETKCECKNCVSGKCSNPKGCFCFDVYKQQWEMPDRINQHCVRINQFYSAFFTVAIGAFVTLAKMGDYSEFLWILGIVGFFLAISWGILVRFYRVVNRAKLETLQCLENMLGIYRFAEHEKDERSKYGICPHTKTGNSEKSKCWYIWISWADLIPPIAFGLFSIAVFVCGVFCVINRACA